MGMPVLESKNGAYRMLKMVTPYRYQYRTWWGITWSAWKDISDQDLPLPILNELKILDRGNVLHSSDDQYRYVITYGGTSYLQKRGWFDTWHDVRMEDVPSDVFEDFTTRTSDLKDKISKTVKFLSNQ